MKVDPEEFRRWLEQEDELGPPVHDDPVRRAFAPPDLGLRVLPRKCRGTTRHGQFNFLRIGSEALAITVSAAALSWLIHLRSDHPALAERVAAGQPGHPELSAQSFHTVQYVIIALVIVGISAVGLLHRAGKRAAARTPERSTSPCEDY